MTATTPENGLSARLHRLARGSVVLAIALGMCGLNAGSATAATDDDTDAGSVELHLTAGVRGTVAPGSAATASLTVDNDANTSLSGGRVTVEINRTPLSDAQAVTSWLEDAEAEGSFDELGTDTTAPVDPESTTTSSLFIPQEALGDLVPGVYPLRASLRGAAAVDGDDDTVTAESVLVVSETAPAPTAVLVPITATPVDGALLSAEELGILTAPDGALTAAVEGVTGTAAVLAVDPAIMASIRVLGSAAPESARAWLQRLDALPNERFALQFGDADAVTQAQAGLPALLQPTTLAPFLDPSRFTTPADPTEAPADTPSPAPTPTEGPVLPDDATLTAVEGAVPGILWVQDDLAATDLDVFASYAGDDVATIVSSDSVSGAVGGSGAVGDHEVLVTDAAASAALSRAASAADAASRQEWLAAASAHLYLTGQSSASAPVLVGLDRDDTRTADALAETVGAVDSAGFGLSGLRASPAAALTVTSEADPSRAASLQRMLDDEAVLGDFATILTDPQLMLSPKRMQILRTIGVGVTGAAFDEAVAAVHIATSTTLTSVDIPQSSTIQLLSANADLPFSVRNDLPWPISVRLSVAPSAPRLEVQANTDSGPIQAGTTGRIKVPVSARVGSGEVDLELQLYSPTGVQIGQSETVRVSVRAEWETIGLVVFGGLIVVLLGLGIIRTVRRKRREHEPATTDAAGDGAEESNE